MSTENSYYEARKWLATAEDAETCLSYGRQIVDTVRSTIKGSTGQDRELRS